MQRSCKFGPGLLGLRKLIKRPLMDAHQVPDMLMNIKKLKALSIPLILLAIGLGNELKAQSNWEVGARFADNIGIDATIPISARPRMHATAYLESFGLGGYFDWMFALSDGPSGLKFYPGVGPEFFFENDFNMNVAGDFGVEYSFEFPLTIGLDWRPAIRLTNDSNFSARNWGILARFRFGEGTRFVKAH